MLLKVNAILFKQCKIALPKSLFLKDILKFSNSYSSSCYLLTISTSNYLKFVTKSLINVSYIVLIVVDNYILSF